MTDTAKKDNGDNLVTILEDRNGLMRVRIKRDNGARMAKWFETLCAKLTPKTPHLEIAGRGECICDPLPEPYNDDCPIHGLE